MYLKKLLFLVVLFLYIHSYSMHNSLFEKIQSNFAYQEVPSNRAGLRILERNLGVANNKRFVLRIAFNEQGLPTTAQSRVGYYEDGSTLFIPVGTQEQEAHQQPLLVTPVQPIAPIEPVASRALVLPANNNNQQILFPQPEVLVQPNVHQHIRSDPQIRRNKWLHYAFSVLGVSVLVYAIIDLCSDQPD